jgi:hypothetical protein
MKNTDKEAVTGVSIVPRITDEYVAILKSWLTDAELIEVNRRNALNEYDGCCATHDFCDSNEAMNEAFKIVVGRDIDCDSGSDCTLCNDAWDLAKARKFDV